MFRDIEDWERVPGDYGSMAAALQDNGGEDAQSKGEARGGGGW